MKISTSSSELLTQLQTVSRVASTRSANPVLAGVQIVAADGRVELRATDQEIGLRVPLSATVESDGSIVLPGRLLLDVARALPGADASLELRTSSQDVVSKVVWYLREKADADDLKLRRFDAIRARAARMLAKVKAHGPTVP